MSITLVIAEETRFGAFPLHRIYCKHNRRRRTYSNVKFDFLGYQFRPRRVATSQRTEVFCGYTPAVSPTALKATRATIRSLHIPRHTPRTLAEIAQQINPLLRGWIGYYGRFSRSALSSLIDYVNQKLKAWIMRKYKRFRFHKTRASLFLRKLARDNSRAVRTVAVIRNDDVHLMGAV